jgi:hypothetical protein
VQEINPIHSQNLNLMFKLMKGGFEK